MNARVTRRAKGFVFECALRNQSIPFDTTFRRDSSSASDEIHCPVNSQNVGKCVDMPALRVCLSVQIHFRFFLREFIFCTKMFIQRQVIIQLKSAATDILSRINLVVCTCTFILDYAIFEVAFYFD